MWVVNFVAKVLTKEKKVSAKGEDYFIFRVKECGPTLKGHSMFCNLLFFNDSRYISEIEEGMVVSGCGTAEAKIYFSPKHNEQKLDLTIVPKHIQIVHDVKLSSQKQESEPSVTEDQEPYMEMIDSYATSSSEPANSEEMPHW